MDRAVYSNNDFNAVLHGMTNSYSKPPYQEEFKSEPIKNKVDYGDDEFYIKTWDGKKYDKIHIF